MMLAQRIWTMDGPPGYGVQSDVVMERSDRVPQLYGYSVCLIAIVVMLVNFSSIVNRSFTLSDPLAGNGMYGWGGAVLTSFEAYKATANRADGPFAATAAASNAPKPTDAELRARRERLA